MHDKVHKWHKTLSSVMVKEHLNITEEDTVDHIPKKKSAVDELNRLKQLIEQVD